MEHLFPGPTDNWPLPGKSEGSWDPNSIPPPVPVLDFSAEDLPIFPLQWPLLSTTLWSSSCTPPTPHPTLSTQQQHSLSKPSHGSPHPALSRTHKALPVWPLLASLCCHHSGCLIQNLCTCSACPGCRSSDLQSSFFLVDLLPLTHPPTPLSQLMSTAPSQ